jgi:ABC-2 type transport system permease protein
LVDGLVRSLVAKSLDGDVLVPSAQLVVSEITQVPEADYFDEVLMGLIGLGIMTNSIISIAVRVSTYRNQAILKRLLVTPLPIWKYFAGEVAAHLVLVIVQVAIILVVGMFIFGADVHGNVAWIFAIALLGGLVFLNIGFILSAWAQSPAAASGMGNAVALPMMFFAGTFFSTATLPWVLPHAAHALPLTPMLNALREVAIDGSQLWETGPQLGILGLWAIGSALIASRVFKFG